MRFVVGVTLALAALAIAAPQRAEPVKNGFDLATARVPVSEIRAGGPSRDGIRSVDDPSWVAPQEARDWVSPRNPVVGVVLGGEARTVPLHLIEYHQVVNATLAGQPVAITYDPLTGVPRAWERRAGDTTLEFGVSGLVHNGSFLMYDRQTESLWVQFSGRAISGPLAGRELQRLRVRLEPLAAWLSRHPDAAVMERPAPRRIDYRYSPFTAYLASETIPFPVKARDDAHHPKEMALGVQADGVARAYLSSAVTAAGGRVRDEVAGHTLELVYDVEEAVFSWEAPPELRVTQGFWFAWKAFHPDTTVWEPTAEPPAAPPPREPAAGPSGGDDPGSGG
jgi:hypothetical protein